MKSKKIEKSQAEMGLNSMVSFMSSIAKDETSSNSLINLIKEDFSNFVNDTKPFFTNAIKLQNYLLKNLSVYKNRLLSNIQTINSKFDLLLDNITHSEKPISETIETNNQVINVSIFKKLNENVETIKDLLQNYIERRTKQKAQSQDIGFLKTFGKTDFETLSTYIIETISMTFSTMITVTNGLLNNIKGELQNIRSIISSFSFDGKPLASEKKQKSVQTHIDYTEISQGISNVDKALNKDFIGRIESFNKNFDKLINVEGKRIRNFSMQLAIVGTALKILAFRLFPLSRIFSRLSLSIIFFSLVVISPFFILGTSVIVGFIWGLSKAFAGNKELITSLKNFIKWFTILSVSLLLFNFIPYDNIWKFLIVFTALVITVKLLGNQLMNTTNKIQKIKTGGKGKGFSGVFLDITKGIFYIGTGLMFLAGALLLFSTVSWSTLGTFLGFVAALGVVMMIFHGTRQSKITIGGKLNGSPMLMNFGAGLLFIAFALTIFSMISFVPMIKLIVFIGALGLILKWLYSANEVKQSKTNLGIFKTTKGAPPVLTGFAIGMVVLSMSLLVFALVPWSGIIKAILSLGTLIAMMIVLKKAIPTEKQLFRFGLLSGALILLAGALFIIGHSGITLPIFLMFMVIVGGMVVFCTILAAANTEIFIGVGVLVGLGVSLLLFGFALQKIGELSIDKEKIDNFVSAMGSLCIGIFKITGYALLAVVGATLMLPVAIMSLIMAGVFWLISKMEINPSTFENFKLGLTLLADAYVSVSLKAIPAMLGATLMLPVVISALLTTLLLTVISVLPINTDNMDKFKTGLISIADAYMSVALKAIPAAAASILMLPVITSALLAAALFAAIGAIDTQPDKIVTFGGLLKELSKSYNDLSIIQLTKNGIKAGLLLPLLGSSYLAAVLFKKIGELEMPAGAMDNFTYLLNEFITKSVAAINESETGLKNADKGLKALSKLVGVAGDLVDVVHAFATMTYGVYDVKDGKLVLVAQKKIGPEELAAVGAGIGKLLQSLMIPLAIISSDDKVWDFGNGVTVNNPFAGGWFGTDKNSGVNRIKKIGEAFLPISEFVSKVATLEMFQDVTKLATFNLAFTSIVGTIISNLIALSNVDDKKYSNASKNIARFLEAFDDNIDSDKFTTLDKMMSNIINNLTDDAKWEKINNNLTTLKTQFTDIAKAINTIDIEKATAFERNVKLLVEKNNGENLKETVEQLKELMGLIQVQQESTNKIAQSAESTSKSVEKLVAPSKQESDGNDFRSVADLLAQAVNKLVEIGSNTAGTNARLNRPLKVIPVETNGNQL